MVFESKKRIKLRLKNLIRVKVNVYGINNGWCIKIEIIIKDV